MSTPLRRVLLAVQAIVLVVVLYFAAAALMRLLVTRLWGLREAKSGANGRYLGIVEGGQIRLLAPQTGLGRVRLTRIAMQEARSPESAELLPPGHDGCLALVGGRADSGWVYQAMITDMNCGKSWQLARWAFETHLPGLPF